MERLIDLAAHECGFDRVALRRRNLVTSKELPYKNPFGMEYDSGDYATAMEMALKLGDWDGFKRRRAEAKKRGNAAASASPITSIFLPVCRARRRKSSSSPKAWSNS